MKAPARRSAAPWRAVASRLSRSLPALVLLAWLPWASGVAGDFARVQAGAALEFPRDHGAHPAFRTEWWYVTGWLTDDAGRERGFQVTFFRVGTGIGADNPSRFAPSQLILAHAAVADPAQGRLLHAERIERALEPLAGAARGVTRVWIGDWALVLEQDRYLARIDTDRFDLALQLTPDGPPVLNGRGGFSQKTPNPRNASWYYSRPQLAVEGRLRVDGEEQAVRGQAWMDHEWSSEIMPPEAQGWDWIGINLHDGGALMAFQMRHRDGSSLWTAGTLRKATGETRVLAPEQVRFLPRRSWRSPRSGTDFPVEWDLDIDGRRLSLRPLMDDQELDSQGSSGVLYWEGAVRVFEREQGQEREIGRGYLEMTGYGRRPSGL
ncbi:carotenoid 1,2-hydratase [Thiohalocapsa marina]|uniref:Carotenoid 1,2-hydratase n=2 Tax=Thiohalocapsa marina TaxID=424902 RepID=A0A5M8FFH1_9GAMM|nr:carotenoid 1,2-hydratase [Thiohalocapsa marina]